MENRNRINKVSFKLLLLVLSIFILQCDLDETQEVVTLTNLVWEDNFNVDGPPDPTKWTYDLGDGSDTPAGNGWGNNELQYYTDRLENVKVENGVLVITALHESFNGYNFTSARLTTRGIFEQQYGRFEARIKLPTGQGFWPTFWMLGDDNNGTEVWPNIGEIDIMEYVGNEPTKVFGSVHGPEYSGSESISKDFELVNSRFDTDFHIFGIEWGPSYINFYVDDFLYNKITLEDIAEKTNGEGSWVFDDRVFYIILNLAVGGNLPGSPNADTQFPQQMIIDYVRVYN